MTALKKRIELSAQLTPCNQTGSQDEVTDLAVEYSDQLEVHVCRLHSIPEEGGQHTVQPQSVTHPTPPLCAGNELGHIMDTNEDEQGNTQVDEYSCVCTSSGFTEI